MNSLQHLNFLNGINTWLNNISDEPSILNNRSIWGSKIFDHIINGDIEMISQFIIEHPNEVNTQNGLGVTLLCQACMYQKYDISEFLLQHGADPNLQNVGGLTPLHWAVTHSDTRFVTLLLEYGCDPTIKTTFGRTPLQHSKIWNNYELYSKFEKLKN